MLRTHDLEGVRISRLVILFALVLPCFRAAGQVMTVEAGASDLVPTVGGFMTFQGLNYEGYLGGGRLFGSAQESAYLKTRYHAFDVALGDQRTDFDLPTDIFNNGYRFFTRGVGVTERRGGATFSMFGGVTAVNDSGPLFQSFRSRDPLGMISADAPISSTLHFYSRNFLSHKQSSIQSVDWRPGPWLNAAIAAGVGANKPYAAAVVDAERDWLSVKAGYFHSGDGFHRLITPYSSVEADRENVLVTARPGSDVVLTAGHQNLLAMQGDLKSFQRATVDQLQASFDLADFHIGAGIFQSHSQDRRDVSDGFSVAHSVMNWLNASASYYQSLGGTGPRVRIMLLMLRERLSPKLSLLEVVNHTQNTSVQLGGSYTVNRVALNVDYQTLYTPFLAKPFMQGIGATMSLKVWENYQLNAQTFRSIDGRLRYTATLSSLVVRGSHAPSDSGVSVRLPRYVVRGHVRDQNGAALQGAAIKIGNEIVYSNIAGEFLLRVKTPGALSLTVLLPEFVTPLSYAMVSAPTTVRAKPAESAEDVAVIVRSLPNKPAAQ